MSDEKRLANELEEYLEHPERHGSALDPASQKAVESLRQLAMSEHPRPGFVNELAQQLREKDREMTENPRTPLYQRLLRLAFSGVALAALALVVFYATGLFRSPAPEPTVQNMETPETMEMETIEPDQGPFAGHRLQMATELEDRSGEVQVYRVESAALPDTVEGAIELGRALGLENPQVYETPNEPGRWTVRDENGHSVSFLVSGQPRGGIPGGLYYNSDHNPQSIQGEPLPFDEAARIATDFLNAANLLPDDYDVLEEPNSGAIPITLVKIIPKIDGRLLDGSLATNHFAFLPDGTIANARINPVTTAPVDDVVAVKSARQALDDLLQGTGEYRFSYENAAPNGQGQRVFFPTSSPPAPGDRVTVHGWLNVLIGVVDGRVEAMLYSSPEATLYELSGAAVDELVEVAGGQVELQGTIVEARQNGTFVLEVESWQPATSSGPFSCETGLFSRDGDRALLQADNGEAYDLGSVDPALLGGERIEVCAESFEDGNIVTWQQIISPPQGERPAGAGGGSGGSSGSAVEAIEVTRVVEEVVSGSSESQQSTERVVPTAGDSGESPYTVGDAVAVTGTVGGSLRREGGELVPYLVLGIDTDGDVFTHLMHYPLYGDQELLLELSEHNRLYVDVEGTIVEAVGEIRGPDNQAILVEAFHPQPDARLQTFLGHFERQTVDGSDAAVLVDFETGARYAMAQNVEVESWGSRVWVAGVIHPTAEVAGLPVLEIIASRSGSDVDSAETASDIEMAEGLTDMHVVEDTPVPSVNSGLPQTMIIERATLGYDYERSDGTVEQVVTPTWFYYGRSPDGLTTFVLRLNATE